jgi:hypothetical protein
VGGIGNGGDVDNRDDSPGLVCRVGVASYEMEDSEEDEVEEEVDGDDDDDDDACG